MNRNQKIALGCGGAGCLGLIMVALVGAVLYIAYQRRPTFYANRNYNFNSNTNRGSNSNSNSSSSTSSSMSDDDRHRLFQAAGMTKDNELILKALGKIGFASSTGSDYQQFVKDHFSWAMKNLAFIQSVNTPEKARAYVNAHLED